MKIKNLILITIAIAVTFTSCKNGKGGASGIKAEPGESILFPENAAEAVQAEIDEDQPAIKLLSKGSILPSSGGMDLLFSSINYAKAQIRVKKVYENNILQFLQLDDWETRSESYKVAKQIIDTTIVLGSSDAPHIRENKVYGLSLDELIKPEPGAIYHIEIRGREPLMEEDFYDSDWSFGNYDTYEERSVDLLASDLALIAKGGDNGFEVFAYNIITGKPVSGVKVKLYDFVQQELGKASTDKDGRASFIGLTDGRFVVATNNKDYAYLDLKAEKSLSTSNFDVDGTVREKGLKTYIFGERGVWPGRHPAREHHHNGRGIRASCRPSCNRRAPQS